MPRKVEVWSMTDLFALSEEDFARWGFVERSEDADYLLRRARFYVKLVASTGAEQADMAGQLLGEIDHYANKNDLKWE